MPRKQAAKVKVGRIEDDTPIIPYAVAETVIEEVDRCVPLDMALDEQRALAEKLAGQADAIYARNESFRKKIRGRGNTGRDYLYAFMRHWLSGELIKLRPAVFARLPQSFMTGGDELDCGALRPSFRSHATKKSPAQLFRSHGTKKSPAQLQREINETLAGKGATSSRYRVGGKKAWTFDTLEAAKEHAERVWQKSGVIASIEEVHSRR